jgi:hypothetical protein
MPDATELIEPELRAGALRLRPGAVSLTAVDLKDFAGHKASPFEVENRVDDVGDPAHAADRV